MSPTARMPRWAALLAVCIVCGLPASVLAASLRLAVSMTPLSLPVYVAEEQGYFASEQLDVQLQECIGGQRCLGSLLEGRAEFATVAELPLALAAFDKPDFAILASFVTTTEDLKIVMRRAKGASGAASLGQQRIGVPIGSSAQYFLDLQLIVAGIDPRSVRTVDLRPEQMVEAIVSGKVDAIATWEPFGFLALKALGPEGHVLQASHGYIHTFNLAVHRRLVGTQDATLERVLRALRRAEQFIQAEPQAARAILQRRLKLEPEFLDFAWPMFTYRLGLDQSLVATMESQARWALRERLISPRAVPNYLPLVHAAPLRKVKPTAASIGR